MATTTKPGPKPGPNTAKISTSLTPEERKEFLRRVNLRKLEDSDLPPRWGTSDLLREVVQAYLKTPAPQPKRRK